MKGKDNVARGMANDIKQDLEIEIPINLFDKNAIIAGGYYTNTGVWIVSSGAASSDYIPCVAGDVLCIKGITTTGRYVSFWNASKVIISGEYITSHVAGDKHYNTAPANAAYYMVSTKTAEFNTFMVVKNRTYPVSYYSFGVKTKVKKSPLYGLKWGLCGDSISVKGYKGDGIEYSVQISTRNNMTLNNLAISGSGISEFGGKADFMCNRVLLLDTDCDIVTVFGGVNDLRNTATLGTMGDTATTTFYGALNVLCNNMITRFPLTPKAIFTPIKFVGNEATLAPYAEAMKIVAARYAIPVLDLFTTCDLQPDIAAIKTAYFFEADGLHPTGDGHGILARKIEVFLENLASESKLVL